MDLNLNKQLSNKRAFYFLLNILAVGCSESPQDSHHVNNQSIPIPVNQPPEDHDYYQYLNSDNYALTDRFGSLRTGIAEEKVLGKLDAPTSAGLTNENSQLRSGFPGLWFQYFEDYELVVLYDQYSITLGYLVGFK